MQTSKIALYEVFGYILPGAITSLAIHIFFCILDNSILHIPQSTLAFSFFILTSYFFGHVNQAIANIFPKKWQGSIFNYYENQFDITKRIHNIDDSLPNEKAIKIMLNIVSINKCNTSNIDTFIEREGFYRGSTVGFSFLTVILIASLFTADLQFIFPDNVVLLKLPQKIASIFICGFITFLFVNRYRRFLNYKIGAVLDALRDSKSSLNP